MATVFSLWTRVLLLLAAQVWPETTDWNRKEEAATRFSDLCVAAAHVFHQSLSLSLNLRLRRGFTRKRKNTLSVLGFCFLWTLISSLSNVSFRRLKLMLFFFHRESFQSVLAADALGTDAGRWLTFYRFVSYVSLPESSFPPFTLSTSSSSSFLVLILLHVFAKSQCDTTWTQFLLLLHLFIPTGSWGDLIFHAVAHKREKVRRKKECMWVGMTNDSEAHTPVRSYLLLESDITNFFVFLSTDDVARV